MAIYRAESRRGPIALAAAALIAGLVGGIAVGRAAAPGLDAQIAELRTKAAPIASSLEVVRSEYPKLLAGGADPGGAEGAFARVGSAFAEVRGSLARLSPDGTERLAAAIASLGGRLAARAPEPEVADAVEAAQGALESIFGAGSSPEASTVVSYGAGPVAG